MKNGYSTITQTKENQGNFVAMLQHRQSSRILMEKVMLYISFHQFGVVHYKLLKAKKSVLGLSKTIDEIERSTQGKTRTLLFKKQ